MLLPLLALSAAACGSEDSVAGPSESGAALATAAALPAFAQIATGAEHTCAVTRGGLIYCWGYNFFGQLGDGTTQSRLRPVLVKGGALRFRRVTAGSYHTCAETVDAKAYCWGNNLWGQLGIGSTSAASRLTPAAVVRVSVFSRVEAGFRHTCGVINGDAYCWGDNQFGQLGDLPSSGFTRNAPIRVNGGLALKSVDPGANHTCGVTTSSRVFCWGSNSFGQLGDGTTAYRLVPTLVGGNRLFKKVSAGALHSCALSLDDKAYCWGDNFGGPIGDGTMTRRLVPQAVSGGRTYQELSAGSAQTCAFDFAKHSWCWGNNAFGALGDGTTTTRLVPVATLGWLRYDRRPSAGSHSCAVTVGGQAYCWGNNGIGQIGDGTRINRLRPRLVGGS
jgi:alpha-tubulin suppressor-like RCC1 family protein